MSIEEESLGEILPTVIKPAIYAYKYRKYIQQFWKKGLVKIGKGDVNVIITGRPGVGKSVLASYYHGEANTLDWVEPGTSVDKEIKPITIGDWTKIVSVIPGQNTTERAKALDEALTKSKELDGIIHVVDWGYTAIRNEIIRDDMINTEKIDNIDKVRQRNLELEANDFKLVVDKISMSVAAGRGPKWIVIAINKVDLYESKLLDAKKYYNLLHSNSNPFKDSLHSLLKQVGSQNLKVEFHPVCSMSEPFEWNNQIISPEIDSSTIKKNYLRKFIDGIALLQNRT